MHLKRMEIGFRMVVATGSVRTAVAARDPELLKQVAAQNAEAFKRQRPGRGGGAEWLSPQKGCMSAMAAAQNAASDADRPLGMRSREVIRLPHNHIDPDQLHDKPLLYICWPPRRHQVSQVPLRPTSQAARAGNPSADLDLDPPISTTQA